MEASLSMSETLPSVLQIPKVRDRSLSVYRELKNAVDLLHKGDFPGVADEDFFVIVGNLEILRDAVK